MHEKLAAMFGGDAVAAGVSPAKGAPMTQIKTRVLSPLQEDEGRYYATALVGKTKDRLKLATVEWRKEPLESWRARVENQMPRVMAAASAHYTLPRISDGANGCIDDTWATTSINAPAGRSLHTAVWTGSEMIVWGGTTAAIRTRAADTIPARIVGQPPALPTRPLAEAITRQSGLAVK